MNTDKSGRFFRTLLIFVNAALETRCDQREVKFARPRDFICVHLWQNAFDLKLQIQRLRHFTQLVLLHLGRIGTCRNRKRIQPHNARGHLKPRQTFSAKSQ